MGEAMEEAVGDSASLQEHAGESEGEGIWREIDDWFMKTVFQKSPSTTVAQRWRISGLAISACNRLKLVAQSSQPVNKGNGTQTATGGNSLLTQQLQLHEINSHSTLPTLGEAPVETQLPNPFGNDDEARRIVTFLGNCAIKQFYSSDGIFKVEIQSKGPVKAEDIMQIASDFNALFEGSVDPIPMMDDLAFLDSLPDVDPGYGSHDDVYGTPSPSNTDPMMFSMEGTQSFNDPLTPESARSVHPRSIPDLPISQMGNQSGDGTYSDNILMAEGDDGMESRQYNQQKRLLDLSLQQLRNDQLLKDLASEMNSEISTKFEEIDQASDRSKLENVKTEVHEQAGRLKAYLRTFQERMERYLNDVKKAVDRIWSGVPTKCQELKGAISLINKHFMEKDWKHLLEETNKITKKLDKVADQLHKREVSAIKVLQNCASAITLSVESILGKQSVNFISVSDFSHWYLKEVNNTGI